MMTGELLGPSPGLVKQSTVMRYSVNFWIPSTKAVCSASGSNGLGGTVTVFSKEAFSPAIKKKKKKKKKKQLVNLIHSINPSVNVFQLIQAFTMNSI